MSFFITLNSVLVLFIFVVVGFIIRKLNIVDQSFSKNLSKLLFNVILPAMIIYSMNIPFSLKVLMESGILLITSVLTIFISGIVAYFGIKPMKTNRFERNIYYYALLFSNFTLMGFPVISAIFGKEGIFYASIFIVPLRIAYNTIGVMLIQRGDNKFNKISTNSLLNTPIIAVLIGLLLFIFSIKLPLPIETAFEMLTDSLMPIGMILAGIILGNGKMHKMFSNQKVYMITFIRLIVIPLIVYMFLSSLNFDSYLLGIPVIISAMPVAATVSMIAEKYDGNAYLGAQCIFVSTALSVITIPVISLLVT